MTTSVSQRSMAGIVASRNIKSTQKAAALTLRLFPVEKLDTLLYNLPKDFASSGGEIAMGSQKNLTKDSSSKKALTKDSIIPILDKLRLSSISTCDESFDQIVEKVWEELELKPKNSPNPALLENLLIKVIEDIYNEQSTAQAAGKKDPKRAAAINRDISLLMFGLLDGYYHTRISQGVKVPIESSIRYNQYLNADIYVNLEYAGEGTYAEIVAKDQLERPNDQPRPLNRITHIAGDCKPEIGSRLFDLIKFGDYQVCSKTVVFDAQTGQRTDLPKPQFIPENYAPRTATGKMVIPSSSSSQIEPGPNVMPKESEDDKGANTVTPQQVNTCSESTLSETLSAESSGEKPLLLPQPESPKEKPLKGLYDKLKARIKNHKVAVGVLVCVLVCVLVGVLVSIPKIPPGFEVEGTFSTSYTDKNGTHIIKYSWSVRHIENPDSLGESIIGEEVHESFGILD